MSRTYHKVIRCGNCCGSNTQYYRNKRRVYRRKTKQQLHIKLEEFVHPEKLKQFKNYWDEPTDGSFLVNWDYIKEDLYNNSPYVKLDMRKFGRYLKPSKFSKKLKKYRN